ncbi:heavy metal translocating P-type ATPase [Halocalculus aciditolerans]|uniref:Heavy metal translocating P-type ATPase n=1 Tax=Halocalculus aciditolerans TaxID=1383812 RepID=A0A830FP92_9EURY|nr:heavy metal translocating P-type ATPase [Halocalculus aciditolerans]GGL66919.1 heavy metal translocating P-type ATPase [Halocalculus aciditolerans]
MPSCTLCGLETPQPPVTDDGADGRFCCRGCLEVARTLDDASAADAETARDALAADADADSVPDDAETAYLAVDGMHCATCEAFLQSRAQESDGVFDADASYAGDALKVTYDADRTDPSELASAVSGYGYRVRQRGADVDESATLTASVRLLLGGFFGMMVMVYYVPFLYPVYLGGAPLLPFFTTSSVAGQYLLWNLAVFAGAGTAIAGYPIFRGALVSLRARRPNMDLLVALASGAAFGYSVLVLLLGGTEVYFDVSIVVVLVVTLGEYLETRIKSRTTERLRTTTTERAQTVRVRTTDGVERAALESVDAGDRIVLRSGERVPLDGTVTDGEGAVEESLLTGESRPRQVSVGDAVVGGSRLVAGGVTARVADGTERTLDRITDALWDAQTTHSGVQRLADKAAAVFVPGVFGLSVLGLLAHLALGTAPESALLIALTVLIVSCPCALGLATPLAVSRGIRTALEADAIVTDSNVFEHGGDIDVVALDKTGTLTTGEMSIEDVAGDRSALRAAAALETYVDHPVAEAVCEFATADNASVSGVRNHAHGVSGRVDGDEVLVGDPDLFEAREWRVPAALADRIDDAASEGYVPVVVGVSGEATAVGLAADTPRSGWREVVSTLADDHRVVVLTGDRAERAAPFRACPEVDRVFAGVPPEGKAAVIDRLRERETVAMVGDGTNDAPALAAADVGVAVADGVELTTDAADVVVTAGGFDVVPTLLAVASATRRRIRTNLAWAFCYNAVAVPLALLGVLNPLLAAVAMGASSLFVVANSARTLDGVSRYRARLPFARARSRIERVVRA